MEALDLRFFVVRLLVNANVLNGTREVLTRLVREATDIQHRIPIL